MERRFFVICGLLICLSASFVSCALDDARTGRGPKKIISTKAAPAAIGPYSQAVLIGDMLYMSGQIAIDPATGRMVEGGIERETRQVLNNMAAVIGEAGMTFADVVQVQVFVTDLDHYKLVNTIYSEYFTEDFPARAAVQVGRLPGGASVEIMAVAVRGAGGPDGAR